MSPEHRSRPRYHRRNDPLRPRRKCRPSRALPWQHIAPERMATSVRNMRVENWPYPTVVIECARCNRRKEWSCARFVETYQGRMLPDVLREVAAGCDRLDRLSAKPCLAVYPQLSSEVTKDGSNQQIPGRISRMMTATFHTVQYRLWVDG